MIIGYKDFVATKKTAYNCFTLSLMVLLVTECQIPKLSQTSRLNFTISSVGRATVGTTIAYFCDDGYELTGGDNTATCNTAGKWSSQIPRCISGKSTLN